MLVKVDIQKLNDFVSDMRSINKDISEVSEWLSTVSGSIDEDAEDVLSRLDYGERVDKVARFVKEHHENVEQLCAGLEWFAEQVTTTENAVIRSIKSTTKA